MKPQPTPCPLLDLSKGIAKRQKRDDDHGNRVLIEAMQKQMNEVF